MKKSYISLVVIILVVVLGAVLLFAKTGSRQSEAPGTPVPPSSIVQEQTDDTVMPEQINPPSEAPKASPPPPQGGVFSGEEDLDGNDVQVQQITYDGSKYSPATITIKTGDIIVFKNTSAASFWPASGPHPTHTNYPEFDPKQAVAAGKTYEFKFTKVGTWAFHDHLNPAARGTVTVNQ